MRTHHENKRERREKLNDSRHSQQLERSELDFLVQKKLKALILHCYENVPYYTKLFDTINLDLTDITLETFQKVPLLTKKICQQNLSKLQAKNISEWNFHSTSGSTGEPFRFRIDKHFGLIRGSNDLLFNEWTGYQRGKHRILELVGHPPTGRKEKLMDKYRKRLRLSAWDLEDEKTLKTIIRFNPDFIYGYTSSILTLAQYISHSHYNVEIPSIKGVITTSESLTDFHRKIIERAFNTCVFDKYGSREFGIVAGECHEHNGLHILEDRFLVEIIDQKLIITCFDNYVMPFVRYDTGDLVENEPTKMCGCGRTFRLIPRVLGRITDFIPLPNNEKASILLFNSFFENYGKYITDFQVVQTSTAELLINVVPTLNFTSDIRNDTVRGISQLLHGVSVKLREVRRIPLERSGKRLVVKKRNDRVPSGTTL